MFGIHSIVFNNILLMSFYYSIWYKIYILNELHHFKMNEIIIFCLIYIIIVSKM